MSFYPEGTYHADYCGAPLSLEALKTAYSKKTILEARALSCDCNHNLQFRFGDVIGEMPREECAMGLKEGNVRDIAILSRVGRRTCFVVREIKDNVNPPRAVLSRRIAQECCQKIYLDALEYGDIIPCKITHLESFGAFCDVGCGISALLPIDCMSVSRISSPTDRFYEGQDIFCAVKSRDEFGRLVLTTKELFGTWLENASQFHAGQTVLGVVRSIESYGVFVELTPNLTGLAENNIEVECGQAVSVFIKSIHADKMKVKLSIVNVLDLPAPLYSDFKPQSGRLTTWVYSPKNAVKQIETVFDET